MYEVTLHERIALLLQAIVVLGTFAVVQAQPAGKIPRIGYWSGTGNPSDQGSYVAALQPHGNGNY